MKRLMFASLVLVFGSLSCRKTPCSDSVNGTFQDVTGIGGCGMIIELNNGTSIEPRNLEDFDIIPEDELDIRVSYHLYQQGGTNCMMGDVVIIDCIAKR